MNIKFFTVFGKWVSVVLASATISVDADVNEYYLEDVLNNEVVETVDIKEKETTKEENKNDFVKENIKQDTQPNEEAETNDDDFSNQKNINTESIDSKIIETFVGTITGYGPDCEGCSGEGYLACRVQDGSRYSLKYNDIVYNDSQYGNVRILAAATVKFPCGTIINVVTPKGEFNGIVLDTGGTMRKAWNEKNLVWIDLAFKTEKEAELGMPKSNNITYNVLRYGWDA